MTRHTVRSDRRPLRILLAEDNPVNQTLAIRVLEKHGHHVVLAKNGREAVEITAHAMQGDRQRTLRAGMDDNLTKPLRTKDLLEAVTRLSLGIRAPSGRGEVPAWSREEALRQLDFDEGLLFEVCKLLLREAPGQMNRIAEAVRDGDLARAAEAAHLLKSGVGCVCARAAFTAAQQLESARRRSLEHREGGASGVGRGDESPDGGASRSASGRLTRENRLRVSPN